MLAAVAGNAGGVIRDVLIGAVPVAAISRWEYATVSLAAGLITFRWHPSIERLRVPGLWFDAAGLGLFAVAGTQKALAFGLHPFMAALLGMLTGIGGGVVRDVWSGKFLRCFGPICTQWRHWPALASSSLAIYFNFRRQ